MQTNPQSRTKRGAHAVGGKLPHPKLPEITSPFFSLAWYFRKLAEHEALVQCRKAEYSRKQRRDTLTFALTSAICDLEDEIKRTNERILKEGLLLFIWAGTTVFAAEEAPA